MQSILLLRGINVGGRNIKMAELKECLENAGYKNVITILQSGNVILESGKRPIAKLEKEIEQTLHDVFNYPAKVKAITAEQLAKVIADFPFPDKGKDFHRYAIFTKEGAANELVNVAAKPEGKSEKVSAGKDKDIIYWQVQRGDTLGSSFGKSIDKLAKKYFITNRNINTLEKILAKAI